MYEEYATYSDILCHHGILGQKWGVRRYQNKDGSLTQKGVMRYRKRLKKYDKYISKSRKRDLSQMNETERKRYDKYTNKADKAKLKFDQALTKQALKADKRSGRATVRYDKRFRKYKRKMDRQLARTNKRLKKEAYAIEEIDD